MSAEDMAKQFLTFYYSNLNAGKTMDLANLYKNDSCGTLLADKLQGAQNIVGKLTALAKQAELTGQTMDVQPSLNGQGLVVMVTGDIKPRQSGVEKQKFIHVFHLRPNGASLYIRNEILQQN